MLVIVHALTDEDLVAIGRVAAGHHPITGGSGIARGLGANFIEPWPCGRRGLPSLSKDQKPSLPEAVLARRGGRSSSTAGST